MVDDRFVLQSLLLCGFQHSVSTDSMSTEVCGCDRRWMILLVQECMSFYMLYLYFCFFVSLYKQTVFNPLKCDIYIWQMILFAS